MPMRGSLNRAKAGGHPVKTNHKAQHPYDQHLYKARLKHDRAIATRYDKTARNFLAASHLAAADIWLN